MTKDAEQNDGFRYGFFGIDNFTKFGWGVPIKSKKPDEIVRGMKALLDKIGVPETVYADQEGSFNNVEFIRLMNTNKIKLIQVVGRGQTIERFNRTIKEKMYEILNALKLSKYEWVKYLEKVLNKYNNSVSAPIKMSPNDARKPGSEADITFELWNNAKRERFYPELKKGDKVRVIIKKTPLTKGWEPKYSRQVYTVKSDTNNEYIVDDGKRKIYRRFELLKVN